MRIWICGSTGYIRKQRVRNITYDVAGSKTGGKPWPFALTAKNSGIFNTMKKPSGQLQGHIVGMKIHPFNNYKPQQKLQKRGEPPLS